MAILSSKRLIQAHALFLFTLAVYLTKAPEVITDSDVVFMLGEAMNIDISPPHFSRPQSPFAICGVLLVADAFLDLIVVSKVPQMNEVLAALDTARVRPNMTGREDGMRMTSVMARLATLYSEIWTLVAASRFCLFFAVSFFIYKSKPGAWGVDANAVGGYNTMAGEEALTGLDQLKNRVVFTYGFMETMFWLWILLKLREERHEASVRIVAEEE